MVNMNREEETGKHKIWKYFLVISAVIVIDQISKFFVERIIQDGSVYLIGNFVHLTLVKNTGAAFGILKNQNFLLAVVSAVFSLIALFYIIMSKDKKYKLCLALISAGAVGNFIDRIRLGYVIDFFNAGFWPAFNIADSAISLGIFFLVLMAMFESRKKDTGKMDGKKKGES